MLKWLIKIMAHFAQLDKNNIVINVIVVNDEDCIDENNCENEEVAINYLKESIGENTIWKQTSYNHRIRFRYAHIGGTYDSEYDVFLYPKPYPSWILNLETYDWNAIVSKPQLTEEQINNSQEYIWNESILNWQLHTFN